VIIASNFVHLRRISAQMTDRFSTAILSWYAENGRELPWRETRDPYKIWISEIIMQQTRVAQGYDYYLRFIKEFPTVEELANADIDIVMRMWQGLGYYSRARNLYTAAKQIVAQGGFHADYHEIRALKGVGDYTAAAISSIAFGMPYAVVDGNVYRVLSRYFGIDTPIDSTRGKKDYAQLAQEMLYKKDPSRYNQAIMDFGALQCTPKSPNCAICPLAESCMALAENRVEELPIKSHTTKVRDRYFTYFYLRVGDEILLRKRPEGDIWQGLYEVPMLETDEKGGAEEKFLALCNENLQGSEIKLLARNVKHQLSHQLLHADFYIADMKEKPKIEGVWIPEKERGNYAVSRLVLELYSML